MHAGNRQTKPTVWSAASCRHPAPGHPAPSEEAFEDTQGEHLKVSCVHILLAEKEEGEGRGEIGGGHANKGCVVLFY